MKVAYFTDTFTPEINGVTNTLKKLSRYLESKGIHHAFFTSDYSKDGVNEPDEFTGIKRVHRFPGLRVGISPESCLAFPKAKDIARLCDAFEPDLIHVATEFGVGYRGMKYAVSRGAPLVMSCHTDYCKYLEHHNLGAFEPAAARYLEWFYSFSDKTLVPSKHTLKRMRIEGFKNLGIWTRGIDTSKFNAGFRSIEVRSNLGIGDKFAFLYVGRLSPEKGLHILLNSIREINRRFPGKTAFVFTGDGPYADTIRQAGFENVILTGFKRDVELSEIYASCDCFAFPSGTETFGNTPLEAMASGLPVVGVASGGVTDFLEHCFNALLCEDGSNEAFTQNLISIMSNDTLRTGLSANGAKTASSRGWNEIFDALLYDYSDLIERKAASALKRVS